MSIEASLLIINSFSVCCLHEKNEINHNAFSLIWPYIAQESLPQVPRSLLTITLRLIFLLYPRNSLEDFSKEIMHFHLITNMATFWEQESLVQDGHEIKKLAKPSLFISLSNECPYKKKNSVKEIMYFSQ